MAGILEEFAYGNVSPEALQIKKDPDYSKAEEFVSYHEQKLLDRLGGEDQEILRRYIDAQSEVKQLTAVRNLKYGYKLGLIMTAEAFVGMDDLYISGEDM